MASKTRFRPTAEQKSQLEAWFLSYRDQIQAKRLQQRDVCKAATKALKFPVSTTVLAGIAGSRATSKHAFAWPGAGTKTSARSRRVGRAPGTARDELADVLRRLIREEVHLLLQGVISSSPR